MVGRNDNNGPSDSQQQKKRTCRIVDFAVFADHSKIKSKRKEGYVPGPCQGTGKKCGT